MNLVTGATGHIGNVLVRELLRVGQKVRALVLPGEDLAPLRGLEVEVVEGDILDIETLQQACTGVRDIYHLAGVISIMPGAEKILQRVNVQGTLNVLWAAREAGVHRLVYTSSIHAITHAPHGTCIDERMGFDPQNPVGAYDRSKAEASQAVLDAAREGLNAVIVCPTGVIGPYDYRRSEMGQLILDCASGKPQAYIDGAYDFVDVRDVAAGMVSASANGRSGETYILSGERITVRRLLESIWEISGKRFAGIKIPLPLARFIAVFTPLYYRLARLRPRLTPYSLVTLRSNSNFSNAKARRELGYRPRALRESLVDTVAWFKGGYFPPAAAK